MHWRGRISLTLAFTLLAATTLGQVHSTPTAQQPTPPGNPAAPAAPPDKATAPAAADTKPTKSSPEPPAKPKPVPPEEKWLYPAQRVSADLESQAWRVKRDLHAVAAATLGATWWKQDRTAAEHWIYPAVDEITIAAQDEADADRGRRLDAARRVLALVTPLDPILRERLKDTIKLAAARDNDRGSTVSRGRAADALVLAAENAEPVQFARAISEAIQYDVTETTVAAILSLRKRLPEEANQLFSRALSRAMSSGNSFEMLAFSEVLTATGGTDIPDQWRQEVAAAYTRALGEGGLDRNERCDLANLAANASEPEDAGASQVLASASAECTAGDPVLAADAQVLQRANPQTSDDYLAVAGQSKSPNSRFELKYTAAEKAESEDTDSDNGGPVRALRIFDAMTAEERAVRPGEYKRLRSDVAVRAALYTIGRAGCSAGLRIVDSSPRETILHIAIGVAEKVTAPACYREVMDIVLRQMRRIPAEDPSDYYRLINLVVRRGPYPEQSLQEILRAMDGWKEKDPKTLALGEVAYTAPWNNLLPMPFVSELFSIPAERLSAIVRGVSRNELLRVDLELHLVRGFLDRYAREISKPKAEVASE
jgi:hypothetical protein